MSHHNEEIARLVADAIDRREVGPLIARMAPGAVVWHNSDRIETDAASMFAAVAAAPTHFTIDQRRVITTPDAVVIQFIMRVAGEDEVQLHCCMVVSVENGQITRIDEYLDPAAVSMANVDVPDLRPAR
jgi:ketosteroid isomerase-like protein